MKVSDYVAHFLQVQRVPCVFEMSGGMIVHLLDSMYQGASTRIVSMHHEQAAAFAADASGRITGIPGVAMATSGPGATNLLTGIGSCYFDSSPAVFITGQVNRNEQKGDRAIRQLGFQETDIVAMVGPITKAAWRVTTPEEVPALLHKAFALAVQGRPGPVLLDIPMDVQRAEILPEPIEIGPAAAPRTIAEDDALWQELFSGLQHAERPLILAGNGVRASRSIDLFRKLVEQLQVPVVNSILAVDVLPADNPLRVGLIGSYGNRWANMATGRSDFLLVLGSRLDIRQTGAEVAAFSQGRAIFHVDCEPGEVNNRIKGCRAVISDLRPFLATATELAQSQTFTARREWLAEIAALKAEWPDSKELEDVPGINPNTFMHQLSAVSKGAATYVVDVGQHQMWAAQSLDLGSNQRFITSAGMGSMGFGLPAAIGACFTTGLRPVVLVAGDGAFQTNIQELQTVVRNKLPIKIVIINNGCHGMVRQFQETYMDSRYQSTLWGYSAPDFARVAEAYGIEGRTVAAIEDVGEAVRRLWDDPTQPALLQVMVDTYANAYPKIAFGRPMTEMEPFYKPLEMEST